MLLASSPSYAYVSTFSGPLDSFFEAGKALPKSPITPAHYLFRSSSFSDSSLSAYTFRSIRELISLFMKVRPRCCCRSASLLAFRHCPSLSLNEFLSSTSIKLCLASLSSLQNFSKRVWSRRSSSCLSCCLARWFFTSSTQWSMSALRSSLTPISVWISAYPFCSFEASACSSAFVFIMVSHRSLYRLLRSALMASTSSSAGYLRASYSSKTVARNFVSICPLTSVSISIFSCIICSYLACAALCSSPVAILNYTASFLNNES